MGCIFKIPAKEQIKMTSELIVSLVNQLEKLITKVAATSILASAMCVAMRREEKGVYNLILTMKSSIAVHV